MSLSDILCGVLMAFATLGMSGDKNSGPLVYAHRGARALAPENTLAAAKIAAQIGADGWEFDVRLTKDYEVILMHDDTLVRTTNAAKIFPDRAPWKVSDFTLDEVRMLDAGSWFIESDPFGTLSSGEVSPTQISQYQGEKIPTLREALALSQELGLLINIEIKPAFSNFVMTKQDEILVRKTVDLVYNLGLTSKVLISSFNARIVQYVKTLASDIKTALLVSQTSGYLVNILKDFQVDAINPDYRLFSDEELCDLRAKGFEIYIWTVNDILDLKRFAHNPCVTGVITDWPQRLLKLLRP
ncbi:MAG: glycerophosphodiester phosphodiesterase family protein [Candidatus Jordarchaeales archaeon]